MNWFRIVQRRCQGHLASKYFILKEVLRARLRPAKPIAILLSEPADWTDTLTDIRRKFKFSRHALTVGDITAARLEDYDLVVPLTIEDLAYLDSVRTRLADNPIPIPSLSSVRLCDDKPRFNAFLASQGYAEYIPRSGGNLDFPYILKKRVDVGGKHSHVVMDRPGELALSKLREDPEYFEQDFVVGPLEYATHMLLRDGRAVFSLNIEYGFDTDTPIKGRDKPVYSRIVRGAHEALFVTMLAAIGFEGLCCVNYKMRNNQPLVLEINPRFGRSLSGYFFACAGHLARTRQRGSEREPSNESRS